MTEGDMGITYNTRVEDVVRQKDLESREEKKGKKMQKVQKSKTVKKDVGSQKQSE